MRVSRDTGRSLADVAADSYARTLYTWGHLVAEAQRDRLVRQGERIGDAQRQAMAFHKPDLLKDQVREYESAIGLRESPEEAVTRAEGLLSLVEEMNEVARQNAAPEPQLGGLD